MIYLLIDTSNQPLSVAVMQNNVVLVKSILTCCQSFYSVNAGDSTVVS